MSRNLHLNLIMTLKKRLYSINKKITIYTKGNMNMCSKLNVPNFQPMLAQEENSWDHQRLLD